MDHFISIVVNLSVNLFLFKADDDDLYKNCFRTSGYLAVFSDLEYYVLVYYDMLSTLAMNWFNIFFFLVLYRSC